MKNKNGVEVVPAVGGRYNIPIICSICKHHEYEIGEMGTVLCGSYCAKNLWFPTKKGTCKLFEKWQPLFMKKEHFQEILSKVQS
jgi:hypothetical protein